MSESAFYLWLKRMAELPEDQQPTASEILDMYESLNMWHKEFAI